MGLNVESCLGLSTTEDSRLNLNYKQATPKASVLSQAKTKDLQ